MKIPTNHGYGNDFPVIDDQIAKAVNNHPRIIMIRNKKKNDQIFSFGPVTYDDALKRVKALDTTKASR